MCWVFDLNIKACHSVTSCFANRSNSKQTTAPPPPFFICCCQTPKGTDAAPVSNETKHNHTYLSQLTNITIKFTNTFYCPSHDVPSTHVHFQNNNFATSRVLLCTQTRLLNNMQHSLDSFLSCLTCWKKEYIIITSSVFKAIYMWIRVGIDSGHLALKIPLSVFFRVVPDNGRHAEKRIHHHHQFCF